MDIRPWHFVVAMVAGWLGREQQAVMDYLKEENRVLREVLGKRRLLLTNAQRRRLARKAKVLDRGALRHLGCIVTPETLLRWYRELVAKKYDGSKRRRVGRPTKPEELRNLVITLAHENRTWGYTRIRDVLRSLGHDIGRTTIQTILRKHIASSWAPSIVERIPSSALGRYRCLRLLHRRGPHAPRNHDQRLIGVAICIRKLMFACL